MIPVVCPRCHGALADGDGWECVACGERYPMIAGIARFLPSERAAHFAAFLEDYTTVRLAEGRATDDPAFLQRLPDPTPGDPLAEQWRMRARSWAVVQRRVLGESTKPLVVADVGAGVGWLSNRLAELGHVPLAVDLTVDAHDGLGAARHFGTVFGRYQAEMDALPFADDTVDLVATLREALRVLAPGGLLVVMDSPLYRHAADGAAMVAERHADFERRFGTRSDSVPSIGYLTPAMLDASAQALGLHWERHRPWYGWRWAWKPWRARLRRRRAPSRFELLVARRTV
jgi:SAM-dependent methyltransferase